MGTVLMIIIKCSYGLWQMAGNYYDLCSNANIQKKNEKRKFKIDWDTSFGVRSLQYWRAAATDCVTFIICQQFAY